MAGGTGGVSAGELPRYGPAESPARERGGGRGSGSTSLRYGPAESVGGYAVRGVPAGRREGRESRRFVAGSRLSFYRLWPITPFSDSNPVFRQ